MPVTPGQQQTMNSFVPTQGQQTSQGYAPTKGFSMNAASGQQQVTSAPASTQQSAEQVSVPQVAFAGVTSAPPSPSQATSGAQPVPSTEPGS